MILWIILSIIAALALFLFAMVLPSGINQPIRIVQKQHRIDERDAIFHRFIRLKPNTPEFEKYYQHNLGKIKIDEKIRALPKLGEPGSKTYHSLTSPFQVATFSVLEGITREIEWQPNPIETKPVQATPEEFTKRIKGFAQYLGADLVGITKLNSAYVYSHIGRSPGKWGEPIQLNHLNAIAIAVEMDYNMIRFAPNNPTTTETAFKYFESAKIAMIISQYINRIGYEARAHVDGNYRVLCVPIAADAGLGELGRLGLLITPKFGPRVRLSIVTTNLPLIYDKPISYGVQHFCSICKKCAIHCPSNAINNGEKSIHAGVEKWQSNQENCYRFWRKQGTDCSVCIKVCPYSHPNTTTHNMVRWIVRRNNAARRVMYWGDRLVYRDFRKDHYPLPAWHN